MELEVKLDTASVEQLKAWWLEIPAQLLANGDAREYILDEIAVRIIELCYDGFEFLVGFAYSEDLRQRSSALCFIISSWNPDHSLEKILLDAFYSSHPVLKLRALVGFCRMKKYPLKEVDLKRLEEVEGEFAEILLGWAMQYQCDADPESRLSRLEKALQSETAWLRAVACDYIGDNQIKELRDHLKNLSKDSDLLVAEAASFNDEEMFKERINIVDHESLV